MNWLSFCLGWGANTACCVLVAAAILLPDVWRERQRRRHTLQRMLRVGAKTVGAR